jgi:hypothetical protein
MPIIFSPKPLTYSSAEKEVSTSVEVIGQGTPIPICALSVVLSAVENPLEWLLTEATLNDLCNMGIDVGLLWDGNPVCTS